MAINENSLPTIEQMRVDLEELVQQGLISPEEMEAVLLEESAMAGINLDPSLRNAQLDALSSLQEISEGGGLRLSDQAQLSKIAGEEMARERGSREAILQNAQQRGIAGSGIELLSQMQNQQDSATRQSARDMDVAAMAQDRALQAILQSGELGGQMRDQDFQQEAEIAKAKDAIKQFNAQAQQTANAVNMQSRQNAQNQNLQEKQRVADQNVSTRNAEQAHNKGLYQQNFQNSIALGNALNQQKQQRDNQNNIQNQQMMQLVGGGMSAMAMSDENVKTDVEAFNPEEFLNSITGYKY